jgi:hypothetical protein
MQVTYRQQSPCRVNEVTALGRSRNRRAACTGKSYSSAGIFDWIVGLVEIAGMSLKIADHGRIVREVMGDDMDDFAFALQRAIYAQHF